MQIRVEAKSDSGFFLANEPEEGYVLFGLDDSIDIEVGDVVSRPHWDDRHGLFVEARNVTRGENVHICIEDWSMSRETAYGRLEVIGSPTKIWTL